MPLTVSKGEILVGIPSPFWTLFHHHNSCKYHHFTSNMCFNNLYEICSYSAASAHFILNYNVTYIYRLKCILVFSAKIQVLFIISKISPSNTLYIDKITSLLEVLVWIHKTGMFFKYKQTPILHHSIPICMKKINNKGFTL